MQINVNRKFWVLNHLFKLKKLYVLFSYNLGFVSLRNGKYLVYQKDPSDTYTYTYTYDYTVEEQFTYR